MARLFLKHQSTQSLIFRLGYSGVVNWPRLADAQLFSQGRSQFNASCPHLRTKGIATSNKGHRSERSKNATTSSWHYD